jgi:riboflavin biosynthesis pyrimidine reductase
VTAGEVVDAAEAAGARLVLTEGGPHLLGDLLAADRVDELFLTISPQLAGRGDGTSRLGLIEGTAFPSGATRWGRLRSVHRSHDHLFLRYVVGDAGGDQTHEERPA